MQLFRSEEDIQAWSKATGQAVGLVFEPERLCRLARRWYDDRLELGWKRRTPAERQAILDGVGLTGRAWAIENWPGSAG
jgi:hypothetical protein